MPQIKSYPILIYSSPTGYQKNRSQISLYDENKVIAYVRFNDLGMTFENDYISGGIIRMHLPSSMFHSVIDILRNEKSVVVYFATNRGFLGTGKKPVSEEELRH